MMAFAHLWTNVGIYKDVNNDFIYLSFTYWEGSLTWLMSAIYEDF